MDLDFKPLGKSPIARRLAATLLVFGALVTIVLATVMIFLDHKRHVAEVKRHFQIIEESYLKSLANSVWVLDHRQIQAQLDGLLNLQHMEFLTIDGGAAGSWSAGKAVSDKTLSNTFTLTYEGKKSAKQVGQLRAVIGLDAVYEQSIFDAIYTAGASAVIVFVLAGLLLFLFNRFVTHRLMALTEKVAGLNLETTDVDLEELKQSIQMPGTRAKQDELDALAGSITDMHRQIQSAAVSLKKSEEYLRTTLNSIGDAVITTDTRGKITQMNPMAERLTGWRGEDAFGQPLPAVFVITDSLTGETAENPVNQVLAKGETVGLANHIALTAKNGVQYQIADAASPIRSVDGTIYGVVLVFRDVTAEYEMREALRKSESQFRLFAELAPVGIVISDHEENTLYASAKFTDLFGYTIEDMPSVSEWWEKAYPNEDFRDRVRNDWEKAVSKAQKKRSEIKPLEYPVRCKNGNFLDIEIRMATTGGMNVIVFTDITERKRAEEEKEKLHSQLLQAQKMESVGRLAGGVAHDFNNMLSVVLGNAEMAMEDLDSAQQSLYDKLREIRKAALRSSDVVRQLLAFARKQTIAPKILDLNEAVEEMLKMLRRLIGEDIDLSWQPRPTLWAVKMDPAQLDQVLANLTVNARDAIGGVGKVTIETGNVVFDEAYCADNPGFFPGDFVLLAVSDDGCGMDHETQKNLFEPFFSTKDVDKGTGLGLATVYGIVKQNNGFIKVYSEPNQGTTFKIYLPRHEAIAEQGSTKIQPDPISRGAETILLVEDEPSILKMTEQLLKRLGYTVLIALTPKEAISIAREYDGDIHLVMTDVVMPEMNGRDLANKLLSIYPNLNLLFMSGYTANVIEHHGVLDEGVNFIQKPFSKQDLSAKLREVLDDAVK